MKLLLTAVFLGAVAVLSGCGHVVATGMKIGTPIKVADEGFWIKTHEVEIVRGGMANGSGSFSTTPLYVTVTDENSMRVMQEALDKQQEVEVTYVETWGCPFTSDSNCKFLTSVKVKERQ